MWHARMSMSTRFVSESHPTNKTSRSRLAATTSSSLGTRTGCGMTATGRENRAETRSATSGDAAYRRVALDAAATHWS